MPLVLGAIRDHAVVLSLVPKHVLPIRREGQELKAVQGGRVAESGPEPGIAGAVSGHR